MAIKQQSLQAKSLLERSDQSEMMRPNDATFVLKLKTLAAEQAKNAAMASADQSS